MHIPRRPATVICDTKGASGELDERISQIMIQYQKKYSCVCELFRLTEELVQMLSYNDHVSTQMVLKMRQDEMAKVDECSVAISVLEAAMGNEERHSLHEILRGKAPASTFEEKKILELYKNIQATLVKTIEIDKRANLKIAGKDSYYQQSTQK